MHKDIEKILYSEKDIENIVNTIATVSYTHLTLPTT